MTSGKIWKTCPHCHIRSEVDEKTYSRDKHYCPMCNLNYNGDEKDKGIKR